MLLGERRGPDDVWTIVLHAFPPAAKKRGVYFMRKVYETDPLTCPKWWKGIGVLHEAVRRLGEDYFCVIVGGKPHYVEEFNTFYPPIPNVLLVGHRPHTAIPLYLKAADVLVLPNSAKEEISRISTSPMKLFEYMAASRPIVASDLPSIREILNEQNALLVAPDDAEAPARGIRSAVENVPVSASIAVQARRDVSAHTWENRPATIISFATYA